MISYYQVFVLAIVSASNPLATKYYSRIKGWGEGVIYRKYRNLEVISVVPRTHIFGRARVRKACHASEQRPLNLSCKKEKDMVSFQNFIRSNSY